MTAINVNESFNDHLKAVTTALTEYATSPTDLKRNNLSELFRSLFSTIREEISPCQEDRLHHSFKMISIPSQNISSTNSNNNNTTSSENQAQATLGTELGIRIHLLYNKIVQHEKQDNNQTRCETENLQDVNKTSSHLQAFRFTIEEFNAFQREWETKKYKDISSNQNRPDDDLSKVLQTYFQKEYLEQNVLALLTAPLPMQTLQKHQPDLYRTARAFCLTKELIQKKMISEKWASLIFTELHTTQHEQNKNTGAPLSCYILPPGNITDSQKTQKILAAVSPDPTSTENATVEKLGRLFSHIVLNHGDISDLQTCFGQFVYIFCQSFHTDPSLNSFLSYFSLLFKKLDKDVLELKGDLIKAIVEKALISSPLDFHQYFKSLRRPSTISLNQKNFTERSNKKQKT